MVTQNASLQLRAMYEDADRRHAHYCAQCAHLISLPHLPTAGDGDVAALATSKNEKCARQRTATFEFRYFADYSRGKPQPCVCARTLLRFQWLLLLCGATGCRFVSIFRKCLCTLCALRRKIAAFVIQILYAQAGYSGEPTGIRCERATQMGERERGRRGGGERAEAEGGNFQHLIYEYAIKCAVMPIKLLCTSGLMLHARAPE